MSIFDTFDFQLCCAPQRCALLRLPMGLQSTKCGPNPWCFQPFHFHMCFAPQRCASFIFHQASWLRTRCPTLRPSGATKHRKNRVCSDFPTFSHTCIFSRLTFSLSDLVHHLLSSLFWLSPGLSFFPGCAFPSVHIVGSLISKASFEHPSRDRWVESGEHATQVLI